MAENYFLAGRQKSEVVYMISETVLKSQVLRSSMNQRQQSKQCLTELMMLDVGGMALQLMLVMRARAARCCSKHCAKRQIRQRSCCSCWLVRGWWAQGTASHAHDVVDLNALLVQNPQQLMLLMMCRLEDTTADIWHAGGGSVFFLFSGILAPLLTPDLLLGSAK